MGKFVKPYSKKKIKRLDGAQPPISLTAVMRMRYSIIRLLPSSWPHDDCLSADRTKLPTRTWFSQAFNGVIELVEPVSALRPALFTFTFSYKNNLRFPFLDCFLFRVQYCTKLITGRLYRLKKLTWFRSGFSYILRAVNRMRRFQNTLPSEFAEAKTSSNFTNLISPSRK